METCLVTRAGGPPYGPLPFLLCNVLDLPRGVHLQRSENVPPLVTYLQMKPSLVALRGTPLAIPLLRPHREIVEHELVCVPDYCISTLREHVDRQHLQPHVDAVGNVAIRRVGRIHDVYIYRVLACYQVDERLKVLSEQGSSTQYDQDLCDQD